MSETVIRINDDGRIMVEWNSGEGIMSFKQIAPDTLVKCINQSLLRGVVYSGLLPKGCISYTAHDSGERNICMLHPESSADISYYGTPYPAFPLPKLVFGFSITKENRISQCRLGVVGNESNLKPATPMFVYPFSNVSGTHLCTGNNVMPRCQSLHTLGSVPYYILGMDNNNDHFKPSNNKPGLEMRDLLELFRNKPPEYYYSNILIPSRQTLGDFIKKRG